MAYQFSDGFDNYGNNYQMTAGYPWDTVAGGGTANTVVTTDYRFTPPAGVAGGCYVEVSNGSYLRKNLTGNPSTLIVGFGYKLVALPPTNPIDLVTFWDTGTVQACLGVTANGALQFYRGATSGTAIGPASTAGTITANTWYGIAVQITFSGSTGSVQCYVNGVAAPTIIGTALNTIETSNAYATQVSIGAIAQQSQGNQKYDDFFCFDTTGAFNNSLLGGDARILTPVSASAGNYTNWTPNGLANNWANAANTPPNTSDYNANNTGGTKDSYTMQTTGLSVAPYFVVARASLERDDGGTHTPSLFVRSNSTDSSGVTTPALSSSYSFYDAVFTVDPSTTAAWTSTGADNAQVGIIEG
jgi:hypothetical protein